MFAEDRQRHKSVLSRGLGELFFEELPIANVPGTMTNRAAGVKHVDSVMATFLKIFFVVLLALAVVGWLADRRAAANRLDVTPGLSFLPGDIKYESRSGNVRVYFPIVTSIVLSVVLTLILRLFG